MAVRSQYLRTASVDDACILVTTITRQVTMEDSEPWCFTVVRTQGMRLMRPEKSWRPIVTVEVDKHHYHETIMGVDGQNPNLKERFELRQAHNASQIDIRIWHLSQSKKKKKRNLVASTSHSLGELIRQQEKDPRAELELRLHCQSASKRAISSRGRPQNGASLLLKIRCPVTTRKNLLDVPDEQWEAESSSSGAGSTKVSEYPSMPPSPTDGTWPDVGALPGLRRRRRRGYGINSDDEIYSTDGDDEDDSKPPIFSDGGSFCGDEDDEYTLRDEHGYIQESTGTIIRLPGSRAARWVQAIWPAVLPQYTERIEVPGDMSFAERVLASFTTYSELKAARLDSQYEKVFTRLQMEWTYVGGLLVALAAVCTAVFAIAPGSFFDVDSYARDAIAASSIASGLGIACDSWFLLRYTWADLHTFIHRARDVYASYFFFALSARVPALCLFVSAFTLMTFMGLVAFEVWPTGVLLTCFAIGLVMTLQFLVFGAHWCVLRVVGGVKWGHRMGRRVLGGGNGTESADVSEVRKSCSDVKPTEP